jgi:hypothetical protein
MKNTTHYLFLATAWLALAACHREDPLPEATQGGKQTFGCRVNGKPFVPDGGTGWNATKAIVLTYSSRRDEEGKIIEFIDIQVTARDGQSFFIILRDPVRPGIHYFNKEYTPLSWSPIPNDAAVYQRPGANFFTGPKYKGKLVLTRSDRETGWLILSGTFEFEAQDPKTGEVVQVTDGRFDTIMR